MLWRSVVIKLVHKMKEPFRRLESSFPGHSLRPNTRDSHCRCQRAGTVESSVIRIVIRASENLGHRFGNAPRDHG